jgi:5-methylcytosine-specific restriction enzyme subunit McrC
MRRIELVEFLPKRAVALTLEECDALRRVYPKIQIEPTLGLRGHYDITAVERIGLVCLPTLVVEIRPKIPMSSVLFLISYVCDAVRWFDQDAEFARESDLVELLAIMLARMVQHATRRGLLNGYQCEHETLRAPRGRIRFDEQIRRRAGMFPPVESSHDVFTSDIIENRLLLAALTAMAKVPQRSDRTKRELSRAERLFGAVGIERFRAAAVPEVVFTRLNHPYEPAIALARIVLRSASLDLGVGADSGSAFLIDMNVVFEQFVRTALREALGADNTRFPDHSPPLFLDKNGRVPLRPDLSWVHEGRVAWVGDAKYKRLPAGAYQNADLYQLLAYAVALDLPGGTLIYAADQGVRSAEYVVNHDRKQLHVVALDLAAPPKRIRSQIASLAERIQSEAWHGVA